MDPKKEARLNKAIIRISAVLFLLIGIGILVAEYVFYVRNAASNITAILIFVSSIMLFGLIIFVVLKNRHRIFNFGEDE